LTAAPLDKRAAKQVAAGFKALADPVRVRIVSIIGASEAREVCVCDLPKVLGLSQPTVSHHLKLLTDAGILDREQRGKWAFFRIAPGSFDTLRSLLSGQTGR
jgi:ArsR family transcriptional regulator